MPPKVPICLLIVRPYKVQSLMTCGLVVQMTCMSIIASAMFFKQHKKMVR